ncbi:uncharacterized protein BT62DRAFT_1078198 [Guyanagaster necrorhizus]|uniref:Uncharacterized protein n=1 Tax=Guyanagaster necrorhizus TaxID=856835 RepID=A0A9P7VNY3_9AGAR|nr:uncharacterized protein BT62DRAFT_1078198 [Guyanagaster necrorhizus MCA 3950]KAG7444040.1 hypothetical protein BT62DRAFT_1078198 [Guyanagaster necrorhizus MCA 3950]
MRSVFEHAARYLAFFSVLLARNSKDYYYFLILGHPSIGLGLRSLVASVRALTYPSAACAVTVYVYPLCIAKSKQSLAASIPPLYIPRSAVALPCDTVVLYLSPLLLALYFTSDPPAFFSYPFALFLSIIFSRPIPTVTSPDPSRSYPDFKQFAKLAYRLTQSQKQIRHLTDSSDSNGGELEHFQELHYSTPQVDPDSTRYVILKDTLPANIQDGTEAY